MTFEQSIEIWYAIFLGDTHIGKKLHEILRIKDDGIARSLGSRNVFYQYILADEVLYVA